jgi:hypothetical protein
MLNMTFAYVDLLLRSTFATSQNMFTLRQDEHYENFNSGHLA